MDKRLPLVVAAGALLALSYVGSAIAEDFRLPQRLRPGDVVSADFFNELFDYLEQANRPVRTEDLVGSWSCTKAGQSRGASYVPDPSGLWNSAAVGLSVQSADAGVFTYTSSPISFFEPGADECPGSGKISVFNSHVAAETRFTCGSSTAIRTARVERRSPTQLGFELNAGNTTFAMECEKLNLPPAAPTGLSLSLATGNTVSLSWTDNSADETGFVLLRKDALQGQYAQIAETPAGAVTATDAPPPGATYWYRVASRNANGTSTASNVASMVLPAP